MQGENLVPYHNDAGLASTSHYEDSGLICLFDDASLFGALFYEQA